MSVPNVPNITPKIAINREEVRNLLLVSIALEELGLAHIINAEAEKLQKLLENCSHVDHLLEIDKAVVKALRTVIKKEILLEMKLEEVLEIPKMPHHHAND